MLRAIAFAAGLAACGFDPAHTDVQPDAQPGDPTLPPIAPACHSTDPDMRLCLDFEDTALTPLVHDASTGQHDATAGQLQVMSRGAQHAVLVGATSYLAVPETPDLDIQLQLTIEMWIDPNALAGKPLDNNGQYGLGIDHQQLYCYAGENHVYSTAKLAPNVWTHVACTYNGSTLRAYVGGNLVGCQQASKPIANVNSTGTLLGSGYAGGLDDVHVHARALADAELQALAGVTTGSTTCPMQN